jgi:hypothetical protein
MDEPTGVDRDARVRWDAAVPEYDAFGREIGENTLAGLGGDATAPPQPRPRPAPAAADGWSERTIPRPEPDRAPEPARVTFSVPEGAPVTVLPGVRRRRAGGLGCLVGLVVLGAVVAGPVIAIVGLVGSASDVIDDVTEAIDPETLDLPGAPDPPPAPTGVTGRSMIAKANLASALRQLERDGFAKVIDISVWPNRFDAETVKGGKARDVVIHAEGGVTRGDASPANTARGTVPIAALDPAAPTHLVRASAKRFGVRAKGIDYVIASRGFDGGHRWVAYFKNGVYVEGDDRGRVIRRID